MKCKDCDFFSSISNTDETGQGICSYGYMWFPAKVSDECVFLPGVYKCRDCAHFVEHDTACMTAHEDDDICCGFEDQKMYDVQSIFCEWQMRGYNLQDKIAEALEGIKDFSPPHLKGE